MSKFSIRLTVLLLGLFCGLSLQAQNVRGTVKNINGEPIPGAFVLVEGTTNGTSTGADGSYSIKVADAQSAVLQFSLIGMQTLSEPVRNRAVVDVILEEETTMLDETVVVGYATVKRRDLLGSVSRVNADKLNEQPVTTVSQALAGKWPEYR